MNTLNNLRFSQVLGWRTARTWQKPCVFIWFCEKGSKNLVFFYVFESEPGRTGSDLTPPVLYQMRQNPYRCKHCLGKYHMEAITSSEEVVLFEVVGLPALGPEGKKWLVMYGMLQFLSRETLKPFVSCCKWHFLRPKHIAHSCDCWNKNLRIYLKMKWPVTSFMHPVLLL